MCMRLCVIVVCAHGHACNKYLQAKVCACMCVYMCEHDGGSGGVYVCACVLVHACMRAYV